MNRASIAFSVSAAAIWIAATTVAESPRAQSPLLQNGDAESEAREPRGTDRKKRLWSLPGWTDPSETWRAAESGWFGVSSRGRGNATITCGKSDGGEIWQEIDGSRLPRATSHLALLAWSRSYKGRDEHAFALSFYDSKGAKLARVQSAWHADEAWSPRRLFASLPTKTAKIRVSLLGKKNSGKWCDAFFDDVVLLPCGKGLPPEFAKVKEKDLIERWKQTSSAERGKIEIAMAFAGSRAQRALVQEFEESTDTHRKTQLLDVILASGSRPALKLLRGLLTRTSRKSATTGDLPLRLHALTHVERLDDWTKICARLANSGKGAQPNDATAILREAALDRLTMTPTRSSLAALARIAKSSDTDVARRILRKLRDAAVEVQSIYAPLLAPQLTQNAESELRDEAMAILAARMDPRYLTFVGSLMEAEKNRSIRGRWIRDLAAYDSVDAILTGLRFVERGVDGTRGGFLSMLPRMRADECLNWCAKDGVVHSNATVRLASVKTLAQHASRYVEPLLAATGSAEADDVACAAIRALTPVEGERVSSRLERLVAEDARRRAATALRSIRLRNPARAVELARDAVRAKEPSTRCAAIEVLAKERAQDSIETFRAAFEDPSRQVRIAAYRAMTEVRERSSIDALVARLDAEDAHTVTFLIEALRDLAGQDNGDRASWKRWWELARSDFEVPARARDRVVASNRSTGTEALSYYGIPLVGAAFVFVVDLSGSMRETAQDRTRLRAAQDELVSVLKQLDGKARFGIVAFSDRPSMWKKNLVRADNSTVDEACRWIENLTARGSTNVFDSIEMALSIPGVETVFLLTDGGPSSGKYTDMNEIRDVVRDLNRDSMIRIHTISTGGGRRAREFLEKLAEENWGQNSSKQ